MLSIRRSMLALIVGGGCLLGGTGVAQAALTGPGGALHGCVAKSGVMRVIGFKSKCNRGEQSIMFGAPAVTTINTLKAQVRTLQTQVRMLRSTLAGVTRVGHTLKLSGMNLQIESGSGSTSGRLNGLGNVIIGYNENPRSQTGSNNLVIGDGQAFMSYGGIVAGIGNTIRGPYASVTGGDNNTASGLGASVTGGAGNTARGDAASVTGGGANTASGGLASVTGGDGNTARGSYASILGGALNTVNTGCGTFPATGQSC